MEVLKQQIKSIVDSGWMAEMMPERRGTKKKFCEIWLTQQLVAEECRKLVLKLVWVLQCGRWAFKLEEVTCKSAFRYE